jgi:hypothetical protein
MVAVPSGSPSISDRTPRATLRIDHQLGTGGELPPLPGASAHFQRRQGRAEEGEEIEDFIEGFSQSTYRGVRINGQRVATWSSQHGWSGDGRAEAEWLQ